MVLPWDNPVLLAEQAAALDLLALGRVRSTAERQAQLDAVDAPRLQQAFTQMLAAGPAVALSGNLPRGVGSRARAALAALPTPPVPITMTS